MSIAQVEVKTLTPLWTGGVDGTMDRVHETGVLGSLRWWYEAIVRGLGGSACDPREHSCPDADGRYCDVCAVFGATGLKRSFRLEGPVWWNDRRQNRLTVKVNDNRGWYLGRGWMGADKICVVPLRSPEGLSLEDVQNTLLLTLRLIECWGGLGPKTQVGYGVVSFNGLDGVSIEEAIQAFQRLKQCDGRRAISTNNQWPALGDFFFAKARFTLSTTPEEWIRRLVSDTSPNDELNWYLNPSSNAQRKAVLSLAPIARYHLRRLIREAKQKGAEIFHENARHHLMGQLGRKSLIHVSHAYPVSTGQWEFRIWGWIPDTLPSNVSRADVLQYLRQWLGVQQQRQWHRPQNGALWSALNLTPTQVCWFERQGNERGEDYLRALLEGCEQTSHGGTENTEN